jgi:hypothetical protein
MNPSRMPTTSRPLRRPLARRVALAGLVVMAVAAAACARRMPPRATAMDAERVNVSVEALENGRSLLVAKCGSRCHKAPMPTDKRADEWPKALDEMSTRANLDPQQRSSIEQYLLAMARR